MAGESAFCLLYGDPAARLAGPEDLIADMDQDGWPGRGLRLPLVRPPPAERPTISSLRPRPATRPADGLAASTRFSPGPWKKQPAAWTPSGRLANWPFYGGGFEPPCLKRLAPRRTLLPTDLPLMMHVMNPTTRLPRKPRCR